VPIYEYRCDDCEALFEVMQKMSDEPLRVCEHCGGSLHKVLHPVAIHFKGSGFYTTDYGRSSKGRPAKEGTESDGDGAATPVSDAKPAAEKAGAAGETTAGKAAKAGSTAST